MQMLRRGGVPGLVLLVLAVGILVLRDATMSRETSVDERQDLVVQVRAHVIDEPPAVIDFIMHVIARERIVPFVPKTGCNVPPRPNHLRTLSFSSPCIA
jgi:hypothetical protein